MTLIKNHPSFRRVRIVFIASVSIFIIVIISHNFSIYQLRFLISHFYPFVCPYSLKITGNQIMFDVPFYSIHHYPEFICPQNFRNLADWIYDWPADLFEEKVENSLGKMMLIVAQLPYGSIIYVKFDGLSSFFLEIYPSLLNKFVLITGQGDQHAPDHYLHYLENSHSKIIHWFSQNGDINATTNERFTHIPIGINCFEMAEGIRGLHQEYSKYILPSMNDQSTDEPSHYIQPFDVTQRVLNNKDQSDKIALVNFSPDTDPSGIRKKLWKEVCDNKQSSFVACYDKPGGVDISSLPAIYRRNRQYPLWMSPRGGGFDCHRTWEALYLDAIPIVWHSTLDSLYTHLPVIIINDWSEINEDFLRSKLHEIASKKVQQPPVYQYEKLRSAYWREMILRKSRHASSNNHTRKNLCWRARTVKKMIKSVSTTRNKNILKKIGK